MTVHTDKNVAQPGGNPPSALTPLRMRETALRQQASQLQARAEHLERVGRVQQQQLSRRVDAHEKIVLGALVKKAGLALPLARHKAQKEAHQNDDDSMPIRRGIAAHSTAYDRALIFGALMWLAAALKMPENGAIMTPERQQLLEDGQRALLPTR